MRSPRSVSPWHTDHVLYCSPSSSSRAHHSRASERKQQMSRGSTRVRAPRSLAPAAAVLVVLAIVSSPSCSRAAGGVRTTPSALGKGSDDAGWLDDKAAGAGRGAFESDRTTAASLEKEEEGRAKLWTEERAATGSRLPDCAHACGACSPCRRVVVSFRCAARASGSESCPVAYRCLCRGSFFHVPSL
ncbi:hypothetical protein ACP70R_009762 [Stipagrostis hirtigluma subsp. patula]